MARSCAHVCMTRAPAPACPRARLADGVNGSQLLLEPNLAGVPNMAGVVCVQPPYRAHAASLVPRRETAAALIWP
eukprot:581426-Prymnesium_polylepis.1